ncbi:MAG: TetR/AcrR family transcriptional regulator [Gammaproteobacteria bacterium]
MKKPHANVPVDRRRLRTRTALRDALIDLITEQGWDDIAVQDICARANIGRSTFYLHYANKDALLQGGLKDLQAELQRQARVRSDNARPSTKASESFHFALGLIEHAHEQRKVFRSLIGRRSGYVVQQRFREMVIRLITAELPAATGTFPREAVARWLAGALVELMSWWIEQRTPLPPQELAALFNELSRPTLAQRRLSS